MRESETRSALDLEELSCVKGATIIKKKTNK
jgi:hypothetical protein